MTRSISVVIPTFRREAVLVETLQAVSGLLAEEDEILLVDQTPEHQPAIERDLRALSAGGRVRWYRKERPSICEAMNVGALLARNEVILFLDDDVVPSADLLAVYRELFSGEDAPAVVNGQILQPWHEAPIDEVRGFELDFDFAYSKPAEVVGLATGNAAVQRSVFVGAGGMDEAFRGGAYRCDADVGFRLHAYTGRRARFEPRASVRHLQAGGGTRAHGAKDSWAAIDSAVGDYYLALRWFGPARGARHCLDRLRRAPFNRRTLARPWLVPWLVLREIAALAKASALVRGGPAQLLRPLGAYRDLREAAARDSEAGGAGSRCQP